MAAALPHYIKYWINSIPIPICTLVDTWADLQDGHVILNILRNLHKIDSVPFEGACHDWHSRFRCIVTYLAEYYGWTMLPDILKSADAIRKVGDGDFTAISAILKFLHEIANSNNAPVVEARALANFRRASFSRPGHAILGDHVVINKQNVKSTSSDAFRHNPINSLRTSVDDFDVNVSNPDLYAKVALPPGQRTKITAAVRPRTAPAANIKKAIQVTKRTEDLSAPIIAISSDRILEILNWLISHAVDLSHSEYLSNMLDSELSRSMKPEGKSCDLSDEWFNGVIFSEVVANVVIREGKGDVKTYTPVSSLGLPMKPRKVILGTETTVKSQAQALRNYQVVLKVLESKSIQVSSITLFPSDFLKGNTLWHALDIICKKFPTVVVKKLPPPIAGELENYAQQRRGSSCPPMRRSSGILLNRPVVKSSDRSTRSGQKFEEALNELRTVTISNSSSAPPTNHIQTRQSKSKGNVKETSISAQPAVLIPIPKRSQSSSPPKSKAHQNRVSFDGWNASTFTGPSNAASTILDRNADKSSSRNSDPVTVKVNYATQQKPRKVSTAPSTLPEASLSSAQTTSVFLQVRKKEMAKSRLRARQQRLQNRPGDKFNEVMGENGVHDHSPIASMANADWVSDQVQPEAKWSTKYSKRKQRWMELGLMNRKPAIFAGAWLPPKPNPRDVELAKVLPLNSISEMQQLAVRNWLLSLGLSVLDGEGGYYYLEARDFYHAQHIQEPSGKNDRSINQTTHQPPPLSLVVDKLRNGVTLCDLFLLLEPTTASHVRLSTLLHRNPNTVTKALENIDRGLWLFRIRKCPPIPMQYLCQPEEILKGNRNMLWGLLYEITQAYPIGGEASDNSNVAIPNSSNIPQFKISNAADKKEIDKQYPSILQSVDEARKRGLTKLPYNAYHRRQLDISILTWLKDEGVLRDIVGGLNAPQTILSLEGPIRDGTLLCRVVDSVLQLPALNTQTRMWIRNPHTYSQCLQNVKLVVEALRASVNMSNRFLHDGVEDEIVRGNWDAILGVFEDMHRCFDKLPPIRGSVAFQRHVVKDSLSEFEILPYLGKKFSLDLNMYPTFPTTSPSVSGGIYNTSGAALKTDLLYDRDAEIEQWGIATSVTGTQQKQLSAKTAAENSNPTSSSFQPALDLANELVFHTNLEKGISFSDENRDEIPPQPVVGLNRTEENTKINLIGAAAAGYARSGNADLFPGKLPEELPDHSQQQEQRNADALSGLMSELLLGHYKEDVSKSVPLFDWTVKQDRSMPEVKKNSRRQSMSTIVPGNISDLAGSTSYAGSVLQLQPQITIEHLSSTANQSISTPDEEFDANFYTKPPLLPPNESFKYGDSTSMLSPLRGPNPANLRVQVALEHNNSDGHLKNSYSENRRPSMSAVQNPSTLARLFSGDTNFEKPSNAFRGSFDDAISVGSDGGSPQSVTDSLDESPFQNFQNRQNDGRRHSVAHISIIQPVDKTSQRPMQGSAGLSGVDVKRRAKASTLLNWLKEMNINLNNPEQFLEAENLPEFSDGVVLCKLIARLERVPGAAIPGTTYSPKSPAQMAQNIKRALEVIANSARNHIMPKSKHIPVSYLQFCEQGVFEGRGDIIVDLMNKVKMVYSHRQL